MGYELTFLGGQFYSYKYKGNYPENPTVGVD
jgi:hypothetical protein